MRNIKLTIEYDGSQYKGWQRQKDSYKTIQGVIENVLKKILQEKVFLIASGRTDTGVSAQCQIANFKTKSGIPLGKFRRALNSLLPRDIVIKKVEEVPLDFHSRFCAKNKTYRYIILNRKHPSALWRYSAYFVPYELDCRAMQKAAKSLLGSHDFRCFQDGAGVVINDKNSQLKKRMTTVRTIKSIRIRKTAYFLPQVTVFPKSVIKVKGEGFVYIDIKADGFLHKMVRNIVGTLIEVGRKRMFPCYINQILSSRKRQFAGPTVPGYGLCLLKVEY